MLIEANSCLSYLVLYCRTVALDWFLGLRGIWSVRSVSILTGVSAALLALVALVT